MNNIIQIIIRMISLIFSLFNKSNSITTITQISPPTKVSQVKQMATSSYDTFLFTIPLRTANGMSGTDFGNSIMSVAPDQRREDAILNQFQLGNVPDFMRTPTEVVVTVGENTLRYLVLPDVLCVGNDQDYLRTPLNPLTARKVGELFGCVLPTKKMADQIWKAAAIKLTPIPNGPPYDESMQITAKMVSHNAKIQLGLTGVTAGQLVSGHKKDVVICKHLLTDASRVAIYGWFYTTGLPIQGLNPTSHDKLYKDYSHGIRMVNRTMALNGNSVDFYDIIKDPTLSSLISDEGYYDATNIYKS